MTVGTQAGLRWGPWMCWFAFFSRRSKGVEATRRWTAVLPILYSIFSALIGTQSVLFSKTLAVLLRSTATGDNQVMNGLHMLTCHDNDSSLGHRHAN